MMQHLTAITHHRFSLIRFRSPLLTESLLFSLPTGTKMFHFPAFPPTSLYIQLAVTHPNDALGFPIRKSWPQRPVIGSTRLIADSHVLHRLLIPRHPPCALNNLQTQNNHKNKRIITQPASPRTQSPRKHQPQDARVHYTVLKQQPQPTSKPAT